LFIAGYGVILTAILRNAFATSIVQDRTDREQVLVDSTLYGHIRNPLYLGLLPFYVGLALWLESYASVILLAVGIAALIARIFVEEKTLRETLPGYAEYMGKVRYRIIAHIWWH